MCVMISRRPVSLVPAACFAYSTDCKGEHPQAHLADIKGLLQTDAYAGFNTLFEFGSITQLAC